MRLERSTRARLTTGLVLTLVLSAGVVLGVALDRRFESRRTAAGEFRRPDGRPGPDSRSRGFDPSRSRDSARGPSEGRNPSQRQPSMIVDQVGLSEDQKVRVDSIVGYYRSEMRALHEEFDEAYNTRYRELNQLARQEVRAVLTDDQQIVYDSLRAEWARRRQERREDSIVGRDGAGNEP